MSTKQDNWGQMQKKLLETLRTFDRNSIVPELQADRKV